MDIKFDDLCKSDEVLYEQKLREITWEASVKSALSGDKSISQTARDLGIKESTLYNWICIARREKSECIHGAEKVSSIHLNDKLNRLRKGNAR